MSITLILGPMFSGKTTELIRLIDRERIARRSCLIICWSKDDRFTTDNVIVTHTGYRYDKVLVERRPEITDEFVDKIISDKKISVLAIEEGQFFMNIHTVCDRFANAGIKVIVSALDGNFLQKPFGNIYQLVPLSEHVVKLNAICINCKSEAAFTARLSKETDEVVVGAEDKYVAVCRMCKKNLDSLIHTHFFSFLSKDDSNHAIITTDSR